MTKQRKRRIMKKWEGKGAERGEGRMIKIGEMRYCVKRRRIKIWEIKKRKRNENIRGRKSVGRGERE